MENFSIVNMEAEHLSQILDIELLCFSVPWSPFVLSSILEDNTSYFYVVLMDNTVIGYAGIRIILDEANLDNIAVLPNYQNQGIANSLLKFIIDLAKTKSIAKLTLEVRESNIAAINLYKKFDFQQVGLRTSYYTKPSENAVLMDLIL